MLFLPSVSEKRDGHERVRDLYSRMLDDRIIFIDEPITDELASMVIAELIYLDSVGNKDDITMYINSPGGSVSAGLAIVDTMELVKSDISTVCIGRAASMAAVILSAGTKGKRFASKRSEILIHQPMGGAVGQASDVKIHAEHILSTRKMINEILANNTGQKLKVIENDTDRDNYMRADEAHKYGIIDQVIK